MSLQVRIARLLVLVLCSGSLLAGTASSRESFQLSPAARSMFGMETGYIWLSGKILIPAGGRPASGTMVSVSDELGVDQAETTSVVFDSTILENHRINFQLIMASPAGLKKIPNTFVFHNKTYSAGTLVETKLDLNWLRFGYGYKLLQASGVWLAPRVGFHYIRHAITVNGKTKERGVFSNSRDLDAAYPVVGLEIGCQFPYGLDLYLEMEGVHLVTRGYLALAGFGVSWGLYPDVVLTMGCNARTVSCVEDNQPLNNEWSYDILGVTAGISFTF
jgi:hypothetical protein